MDRGMMRFLCAGLCSLYIYGVVRACCAVFAQYGWTAEPRQAGDY